MTTMSKACLPPIQPHISDKDRAHPLFATYMQHRIFCSNSLIQASSFQDWLFQRQRDASMKAWEQHPRFTEWQRWMWENKGGTPGRNPAAFPKNFEMWLEGARW